MSDRDGHLQWCKERALEYADRGDEAGAIASLRSDLGKHSGTRDLQGVVDELMFPLLLAGHLNRPGELRHFIEGFS